MKRAAVLFSVTVLSSCCVATPTPTKHSPPLRSTPAEQALDKTVALVQFINSDMKEVTPSASTISLMNPYCSGVWVSNDVILSAAHCVDDIGKPDSPDELLKTLLEQLKKDMVDADFEFKMSWDPTGQTVYYVTQNDVNNRIYRKSKIIAYDKLHDLTLIKVEKSSMPKHLTSQLADEVHIGEDLHIVGHPIGKWWTYVRGFVAAVRNVADGPDDLELDAFQVSAPIWIGNSGGGAFNNDGKLIGICSWVASKAPNMAFYVQYHHIKELMKKNGVIPASSPT